MHKMLLLILTLVIATPTLAQKKTDDLTRITQTIQNYYDGYIERDIDKLNKAFDTDNGTMKVPTDNGFKNVFFKELIPKWGNRAKLSARELQDCALQILNIDIEYGNIASAKMSMKVGDRHSLTS